MKEAKSQMIDLITNLKHTFYYTQKQRRHAMDNFYPHPLTIIHDRYNGCYSGGEFTAWNLCPENIPEEIDSDDVSCCVFFNRTRIIYGRGKTPDNAVVDLINRLARDE